MKPGQSSKAYGRIKAMICDGTIAMGERLREVHLAQSLRVSRTPIREALQQLAAAGLVEADVHGFRATVYSPARVAEIYGCRALLESESARLVALHGISADSLQRMEHAVAACEVLLAEARTAGRVSDIAVRRDFLEHNNTFHAALHESCPNAMLRELIAQVGDIPASIRNYFRFSDDQLFESHNVHKQILRAIAARDGERAAAQMREHIWAARDRMDPDAFKAISRRDVARPDAPTAASSTAISVNP